MLAPCRAFFLVGQAWGVVLKGGIILLIREFGISLE